MDHADADARPLLDAILVEVPEPGGDPLAPLQILAASLDYDNYLGRLVIGRVVNGTVRNGQQINVCRLDGTYKVSKITKLMAFEGLRRAEVEFATAGDIVVLAGIEEITIGETVAGLDNPEALPPIAVDEPTVSMTSRSTIRRSRAARASTSRAATSTSASRRSSAQRRACASRRPTRPTPSRCRAAASCTSRSSSR